MYVVDLDNTLLSSDLLYESFFDSFRRDPFATLGTLFALRSGRAAVKARLAKTSEVDVAHLPYNADVLAAISQVRQTGGKVALVSASDQQLVHAVAEHLDCFDEVFGSNGKSNLKGAAKADFLVERYGHGGFDYVGDSSADLAVWKHARKAITVGAPDSLRSEVERVANETEHLTVPKRDGRGWWPYMKALRPHQWAKNSLVFVPAVAAHSDELSVWLASFVAFISFSLVASGAYVLNDLLDLSADRAHPSKKDRPFASGAVPIAYGVFMLLFLPFSALVLAAAAAAPPFLLVLAIYYILTLSYSFVFKQRLVIDICVLAGLYSIRVIAGGAATGIALTPWLLAFSGFLFLSLAAVKRSAELVMLERLRRDKARGRAYRVADRYVVTMMAVSSGYISVLVLALYTSRPAVKALYESPMALWAVCPILIYWISRVVMISHRGRMHDDPVVFALRDRISLGCGAAILAVLVAGAYL